MFYKLSRQEDSSCTCSKPECSNVFCGGKDKVKFQATFSYWEIPPGVDIEDPFAKTAEIEFHRRDFTNQSEETKKKNIRSVLAKTFSELQLCNIDPSERARLEELKEESRKLKEDEKRRQAEEEEERKQASEQERQRVPQEAQEIEQEKEEQQSRQSAVEKMQVDNWKITSNMSDQFIQHHYYHESMRRGGNAMNGYTPTYSAGTPPPQHLTSGGYGQLPSALGNGLGLSSVGAGVDSMHPAIYQSKCLTQFVFFCSCFFRYFGSPFCPMCMFFCSPFCPMCMFLHNI